MGRQHENTLAGPSHQRSPSTLYNTQPEPRNPPPRQSRSESARIEEIPKGQEREQALNNDEEDSESESFEDANEQQPRQNRHAPTEPEVAAAGNILTTLAESLQAFNDNREPPRAKLRELDTFTGQDPQKLRAFLMQCRFQFRD